MKNAVLIFVTKSRVPDFWITYLSLLGSASAVHNYDLFVCTIGIDSAVVNSILAVGAALRVRVIDASRDDVCQSLIKRNPLVSGSDAVHYGVPVLLRSYALVFQIEPGVIFQKDVSSVFATSVSGYYLAAIPYFYGARTRPTAMRRYGVPNHPFYFDEAAMLFDLVRMRKLHMWKKLLAAHAANGMKTERTVILNQVLGSNVAMLPAEYAYPCKLDFEQPRSCIEGVYGIDLDEDIGRRYGNMTGLSVCGMSVRETGGILASLCEKIINAAPAGSGVRPTLGDFPAEFTRKVIGGAPRPSFRRIDEYLKSVDFGCRRESDGVPVVVSLTTIPARIGTVALTIYQLLHQTYKPDSVCLWLAREQFPDGEAALPDLLKRLCGKGLRICWADENLGPHTKYYFAMQENPDAIVITVDDDVVYPLDLIETLMRGHQQNPWAVVARRAHLIGFTDRGELQPYKEWEFEVGAFLDEPLHSLCATGVGGVLYPPHALPEETFNRESIKELAFKADDIWLKIMEAKNNIPVVVPCAGYRLEFFAGTQDVGLLHGNVSGGGNDEVISAVLGRYDVDVENRGCIRRRMLRDEQTIRPVMVPDKARKDNGGERAPVSAQARVHHHDSIVQPRKADLEVCFICDNGYIVPTSVAITSLLQSKFRETVCHIYIVAADLSTENEEHFKRFSAPDVSVTVIRSSSKSLEALHAYSKKAMCVASPAALLKFSLGELLPHLDKVLYIDGDLLVRSDLSSLYAMDLGKNLVAAVPDSGKLYSQRPILHSVKSYFNSGVLLLNLKAMRDEGMKEKLLDAKRKSTDVSLMDQNIFNQVFDGRVYVLPIRYNCLFSNLVRAFADGRKFTFPMLNEMYHTHYRNFVDLKNDAAIIHFASKEKPWKYIGIPLIAEWDRIFRISPVNSVKLTRQKASGPLAEFNVNRWFDLELERATREVIALKASESYRFGMAVTKPLRWLYSRIQRSR